VPARPVWLELKDVRVNGQLRALVLEPETNAAIYPRSLSSSTRASSVGERTVARVHPADRRAAAVHHRVRPRR
jgi:hypothetical protein